MKTRRKRNKNAPVIGGIEGRRQHQRRKRRGPETAAEPVTPLTRALVEGVVPLDEEVKVE